jgi:hypothetical protein
MCILQQKASEIVIFVIKNCEAISQCDGCRSRKEQQHFSGARAVKRDAAVRLGP